MAAYSIRCPGSPRENLATEWENEDVASKEHTWSRACADGAVQDRRNGPSRQGLLGDRAAVHAGVPSLVAAIFSFSKTNQSKETSYEPTPPPRALKLIGLIIAGHVSVTNLTADLAQSAPAAQAPPAIQETVVQPWHVSRRDAHENVWESITEVPGPLGHPVQHKRRFVELCVGLNMRDAQGTWQPAEARFEITPDGVQATHTAHKVRLPGDIATPFGVQVTTPDGHQLRSHALYVGYYDPVDGRCVILATLTNATGWLIGADRVVYSNCFAGTIQASISYHLTRAGLAQGPTFDRGAPHGGGVWSLVSEPFGTGH